MSRMLLDICVQVGDDKTLSMYVIGFSEKHDCGLDTDESLAEQTM